MYVRMYSTSAELSRLQPTAPPRNSIFTHSAKLRITRAAAAAAQYKQSIVLSPDTGCVLLDSSIIHSAANKRFFSQYVTPPRSAAADATQTSVSLSTAQTIF